ncbi:MAG TPA: hypothetical protein VFA97_10325 [Gaiellaceae bacterium]|nr:hypothetical protein [Gaiellaceae bacterium]
MNNSAIALLAGFAVIAALRLQLGYHSREIRRVADERAAAKFDDI